ncbi:putative hydrolase of the HAD superfamily [Nocardiopsis mwathae]|uniref:Putative hydrolase of the HAD superfamily n=1 Tax=Nocardiopsis mwathae TaxID=1472723 RepID=A0A7W9YN03_9ACTN|nr:HAD family hydrolase [Nocardiopsis mwathae]MBB6175182.1 putative hydrolase of the HAD superfamily [Nocardiopsis mwathae]
MGPCDLIFDADDTLWEETLFFVRATDAFVDYLDHPTLSPDEVRRILDDIERDNSAAHGYGAAVFEQSLVECLERLRPEAPVTDADREVLRSFREIITDRRLELIAGVEETLHALVGRHRLFLLTKGHEGMQRRKIEESGLAPLFAGIGIVPEKDRRAYDDFAAAEGLDRAATWMIGNSPKSDILPALKAGMGAVFVPHPMTWTLEQDELPANHDRFHTVSPIGRLTEIF